MMIFFLITLCSTSASDDRKVVEFHPDLMPVKQAWKEVETRSDTSPSNAIVAQKPSKSEYLVVFINFFWSICFSSIGVVISEWLRTFPHPFLIRSDTYAKNILYAIILFPAKDFWYRKLLEKIWPGKSLAEVLKSSLLSRLIMVPYMVNLWFVLLAFWDAGVDFSKWIVRFRIYFGQQIGAALIWAFTGEALLEVLALWKFSDFWRARTMSALVIFSYGYYACLTDSVCKDWSVIKALEF